MRYIEQFREGMRVSDVYLCKTKQHAVTKNGKEYASVLLQDKTGTVDCKIWDLSSPGINDFEPLQYVYVDGDVTVPGFQPVKYQAHTQGGRGRVSGKRLPSGQLKGYQDNVSGADGSGAVFPESVPEKAGIQLFPGR
jgi:hypothetical protein